MTTGFIFSCVCPDFHHATRSAKVVTELLGNYAGYLQTDGYAAYHAACKATHVVCLAHARRKWVECLPKGIDNKNSKAAQALELIEQIFAADEGFEGIAIDKIYEKRKEDIVPILEKYWSLMENIHAPQGSNLQKAVTYSLNQKENLNNVLLDGRLEWTNNLAERAVKPFVTGRKNWLFSDTDKGADASARCYSMIESAKRNNLNVFGYLSYLLKILPQLGKNPSVDELDKLMPWADGLPEYCGRRGKNG